MPASRKRKYAKPKRGQDKKVIGGDPDSPKATEWRDMRRFSTFEVEHDELSSEERKFAKNEIGLVLPTDRKPGTMRCLSDYWVGRILNIRQRLADSMVWVEVQWYYSPKDLAAELNNIESDDFGILERIESNHRDIILAECFDGKTKVTWYDERRTDPQPVGDNEFFCRFKFDWITKTVSPAVIGSCKCKKIYDPDEKRLMRFCPRPKCRLWFHEDCLGSPLSNRDPIHFLETSPDSDETLHFASSHKRPSPSKRRKLNSGSTLNTTSSLLDDLPQELVSLAQHPIVKGAKFTSCRVVGNVSSVVKARQVVISVLQGSSLPNTWRDGIDFEKILNFGRTKPVIFACPQCESCI